MFERAIEIDPEYALAYAGIADCCSLTLHVLGRERCEPGAGRRPPAGRRWSSAPIWPRRTPSRGFALTLSERYDEADREFETAIRLNPKLFEPYLYYANARLAEGKLAEAAELYERAAELRPEDYQALVLAAQCYVGIGDPERAKRADEASLQRARRQMELYPEDVRALYMAAGSLCGLGQVEEGLQCADKALALDPDDAGVLYNVACINAAAGRTEQGLDLLERAVQNGFGHREWIENDPDLETLRSHPRYLALLTRL